MEKPKPYKLDKPVAAKDNLLAKLRQKKLAKQQPEFDDDQIDNQNVLYEIRDLLANLNERIENFLED